MKFGLHSRLLAIAAIVALLLHGTALAAGVACPTDAASAHAQEYNEVVGSGDVAAVIHAPCCASAPCGIAVLTDPAADSPELAAARMGSFSQRLQGLDPRKIERPPILA